MYDDWVLAGLIVRHSIKASADVIHPFITSLENDHAL
jgi:hypothetical protein